MNDILSVQKNLVYILKNDSQFFHFLWSLRQSFNTFRDLSLESRNTQTQNCAPIQCTVWPRNEWYSFSSKKSGLHSKKWYSIQRKKLIYVLKMIFFQFKKEQIYVPKMIIFQLRKKNRFMFQKRRSFNSEKNWFVLKIWYSFTSKKTYMLQTMTGRAVSVYWKFCWCVSAPLVLFTLLVSDVINYSDVTLGTYKFPPWCKVFGAAIMATGQSCIYD